jgi:hypothetical protein
VQHGVSKKVVSKIVDKCVRRKLLPQAAVFHEQLSNSDHVRTHVYSPLELTQTGGGAGTAAAAAAAGGPLYLLTFEANKSQPVLEMSPAAHAAGDVGGGHRLAPFSVQVVHNKHIPEQVASVWAYLATIAVVMEQWRTSAGGDLGLSAAVGDARATIAAHSKRYTGASSALGCAMPNT